MYGGMEVQHHTLLTSTLEGSDCPPLLLRSFIPGQINFCGDSYDERLTGFCSGSGSDDEQLVPYLRWGSNSGPQTLMLFLYLLTPCTYMFLKIF